MFAADLRRNRYRLTGPLARRGYDWWWHSFTARHAETGAEKAFFVEYFVCNPALAAEAPEFGGAYGAPSYGMIKVGCWGADARQLHSFFGMRHVEIASDALAIRMGQNQLSETAISGAVQVTASEAADHPEWARDLGTMRWQLAVDKQIHYSVGYGASAPARALNAFEMYWHAEGIRTEYSGWVELDGERYQVTPETCFGYADKNWGSNFTSPWLWISSCDLASQTHGKRLERSALEIGGGRPKVLGVALERRLLAYLVHEGQGYDFNFSKPWQGSSVGYSFHEGEAENRWSVIARNRAVEMQVDVVCPRNEMLLMRYQSPDGALRHNRLWNGGTGTGEIRLFARDGQRLTTIDVITMGHVGCEYGEYDAPGPYRARQP